MTSRTATSIGRPLVPLVAFGLSLGAGLLAQSAPVFLDNGQRLNDLASRGVALADLNGDGFLDAFVVNENTPDGQGHRIYFGDGAGRLVDSGQILANASNWSGRP